MNRDITRDSSALPRKVKFESESHNGRSVLQRLSTLRGLIASGLLAEEPVTLVLNKSSRKSWTFPASSEKEAESFAQCVRLIVLLEENLQKSYTATRRDVFYQDVEMFKSQANVDSMIKLLGDSLGITGEELGAVAAQKGIFHGSIRLKMSNGETRVLSTGDDTQRSAIPTLIPRLKDVVEVEPQKKLDYILIVEKEAVFNALCTHCSDSSRGVKRILITAKGFPDVLSRSFVHRLTRGSHQTPVFGLSDFDPYGLSILQTFRRGGKMKDEESACPALQLTGASISDFIHSSCCLQLSTKDFNQCRRMLLSWEDGDLEGNWRRELQRMMFFGKKAELDVIKTSKTAGAAETARSEGLQELALVKYIDERCAHALNRSL